MERESPLLTDTPNPAYDFKRTRKRRSFKQVSAERKTKIGARVKRYYDTGYSDRSDERLAMLQRYAKYRQWTEGRDLHFENSSDAAMPDMASGSLREQDTVVNATLSARPALAAKATNEQERTVERDVDTLIDYQFFVEQKGEEKLQALAESFVNDPCAVVFTPWVRESIPISEVRFKDPLGPDQIPQGRFEAELLGMFPDGVVAPIADVDSWDYTVETGDGEVLTARFYSEEEGDLLQLILERDVTTYDGPCVIVKNYADVMAPKRAANLQPPGPSNPNGATWVVLVDRPTVEEVARLQKKGVYDLMSDAEVKALPAHAKSHVRGDWQDDLETQKDALAGKTRDLEEMDGSHKTVTRLLCFDTFQWYENQDPIQMVFWVIVETGQLVRARPLSEIFPHDQQIRPLATASYLPVQDRWSGISFLELTEGLHDTRKMMFDIMVDGGTIASLPFGFYRAASGMNPEIIRMNPMDLYPLADPKNDINIPQLPSSNQSFGFNLMSVLGQLEERLTVQSELSFGRVPQGKASALRTVRGMQAVLSQGEARPERILRRWFGLLATMYQSMHQANKRFLPPEKKYRVAGFRDPSEEAYRAVKRDAIDVCVDFEFTANVQNASREAQQVSLESLAGLYLTPLGIQLGMIRPDGAHRLMRDLGRSYGHDPDRYLSTPPPEMMLPPISVEEALTQILHLREPNGRPLEGAIKHLEGLAEFRESDAVQAFTDQKHLELYIAWTQKVTEMAQAEQQQQAAMQAAQGVAGQFGGQGPPGGGGGNGSQPPISGGSEMLDESLPSAGGGQGGGA